MSILITLGLIIANQCFFWKNKSDTLYLLILLIIGQAFFINGLPELDTFMANNNLISNNFMLFMSLGTSFESIPALIRFDMKFGRNFTETTLIVHFFSAVAIWAAFLLIKM